MIPEATPLQQGHFRLTAPSGFGDGLNHYGHSMAWFRGKLFVGTTRGAMQMNKTNMPRPDLKPWPVDCPNDIYEVDRHAEIWCYDPATRGWTRVYRAPQVSGRNGRMVPRYIGYRGMAVFQGASDDQACLYVSTWAPAATDPPEILRSEDGQHFAPAARPPFSDFVRSFRTLQPYRGRIHTSPTSSRNIHDPEQRAQDSVGSDATIYATHDILSQDWRPANEAGFGSPANLTIFEMAEFAGRLYAATVNPQGFELWRTEDDGVGEPPYRWKRVLHHGAGRGPYNEVGASLCVFNGALYVGTGVLNGGFHRNLRIGPAAAEVLRVWPNDSWELLVGHSRVTPDGIRYPLSGLSPGFDNLFQGYVWRMCVHDGWLYVGTFCWANMLPYLPVHVWPEDVMVMIRRWGMDRLAYQHGGSELWCTRDGIRWQRAVRNGFDNPYNWGIRNMMSTPHGLFVATANPFGPTVAQRREGEWRYLPNPRGGTEVWLGNAVAGAA